jgi:segregation and condensation protein A
MEEEKKEETKPEEQPVVNGSEEDSDDLASGNGKYKIALDVFEGPFDLLLHLIRENELDIYRVRLSEITDQYISYIEIIQELDLEIAGEFLVIAATLLHLKSRALLPEEEQDEEEEFIEEDAGAQLIKQLIEYHRFKEASSELRQMEDKQVLRFERQRVKDPLELEGFVEVDLFDLLKAFQNVLQFVRTEDVTEVEKEPVSIEEKMAEILTTLMEKKSVEFEELFKDEPTRQMMVVTFLAMLELTKQQNIVIRQDAQFGNIHFFLHPQFQERSE